MKNSTLITMTIASVFATSLMLGSANAEAGQCKSSYVVGVGESAGAIAKFRKRRAERRAKRQWVKQVKYYHGSRYSDFDDAIYASMSCGLNERGNTRCTIKAKPCR